MEEVTEKNILVNGIENQESDGNTSFLRAARNGQLEKVLEHLKTNIDINTSNANGLNALHLASKDGHVEIVEELLKRGAIVDAATKKGNTALHIASLAGQEEVVKLLVHHGASVNVQSQNGFTPLYMAAQENHDNVVKFLLANGANQSLSTEDGFTPLAVAMQQGHDKVVTVLLENDTRGKVRLPALHIAAKKDDVRAAKLLLENDHNPDVTSKSGFTPLHIASHYGNQSIANLLIQKGADVNYSAKHNITPLHVAAKWGKNNMVAVLLEQGAHIEAKTRDGLTPLHCAARSGHEQVVDMLLEKSAPISSKTKNGLAPLHMAAQGDHVDAARILLYHRAPVDEVTVDYLTALHVAAHCGHVRVAKLLLDRQADANARALNGFTPLHIACKKNRIKVVELLLKHGACIAATTESGLTPLHVASFMGCMNIVIYLLQHDASPDIPTVRGETPLHLAARANQTDIIRILLRNGAQVDARAREQQTPLHIASRLGNVDIVMLLLQHGAKVDNSTKDMYTALHIAAKEGQDEVAAVLIENGASLNATTKKGFTPLHLAAKYGHLKVAKLLLQKEAPVDAQGKNGVTPLHVASHYDHQNVALLLLDKGASPHANAKNGHTPLHIAARKNQMDIAHTLLEYGAQPDAESKAGFTPLHLSSQEGHTEISALLLEHKATPSHQSKNGLTPMHLCAQENKVGVAQILHNNGAEIDPATKGGYTPLHIASHYGQADMVKFLLSKGADVKGTTSIGYTPLHQAAQQGHTNIVNILLENSAQPNAVTNSGQTPLHIAQKLGYITVIDTLKEVTESTQAPSSSEEKYRVVAPEAMQETYLSDSEEEGEDTLLGDQTYRYLTADEMKSLGDDSLPIDVTRDERIDSNRMVGSDDLNAFPPRHIEDSISPEHIHPNYVEYIKKTSDNIDISKHPLNIGFLVSFLVDARGGAMRGCRHSGVRVIVPPRSAHSPTRITCRYVRPQRTPHPPPLMEGEALASRVLELGPVGATFLGPVIIEVPHFAALRGKEREIVVLRSDNGESWKEHTVEATEDVLNEILRDSFDADDLNQLEDASSGRITRIVTQDFPQYFAVISRIRQEVHAIGPEGGMVSSTVVPQVQAVFPQGALTKKIKVGLQAQPIDPELTAKMLGHGVAVSPVVTVEPRRRKFHKAITLSMPAPRAHSQGMINQYSGSAPTLRLLCSITGGTSRAQWEDVTGSTPLTFVNDCVSFTTTVSARFWLMDCRNIGDATKMATELYREAIHVPFIAKFMVFAKRIDPLEARLRVFCMTDDKEDKTLEYQEQFTEIAKSRDVEVLEGKSQYIEFVGNLVPVTKSGEQLQFSFRAFKENRLPFSVRVKDQHAEAVSRCLFMREPKVQKGEPPQQPICILNILLPDDIVSDTISLTDSDSVRRKYFGTENFDYYRQDPRLADISNLLGDDWIQLANQLGLTSSEINVIKSEYPDSVAKQAQSMLRMWLSQSGNRTQANTLDNALRRIGRDDIVIQCLNEGNRSKQIMRIKPEEKEKYRLKDEISDQEFSKREDDYLENEKGSKTKSDTFDKYSAEEKSIEPSDEEDDFNKTVPEIREQIVKRLSHERTIPASSQRVEIVQEISSIKRKSLVEDKIAEVQQKTNNEPMKIITIKPASKISLEKKTLSEVTETKTTSPEYTSEKISESQEIEEKSRTNVSKLETQEDSGRRDSILLEEVTHRLEYKKPVSNLKADEDPKSPKFSKTPPPSPADFIMREKEATTTHEWCATKTDLIDESTIQYQGPNQEAQGQATSPQYLDKLEGKLLDKTVDTCVVELSNTDIREVYDFEQISNQTNAFLKFESEGEPYDVYTDLLHKDMKTENESPRNTTIEKKKVKKGIFKTLKTFITKSTENLVSESEKLSPKKEKIDRRMRTSSDVQVESSEHKKPAETVHKMDEEKQNKLSEEYKPKKTTNVKDMPTNIVASTYQADEIKNDSNKTIVKTMAESTAKNIPQPPDTKDIETNILADNSKANRKKEEIYLVNDPTEIKKEILVYADEITKTEEKIDRTDQNKENNTRDLVTISNRSLNYNNKSEDSEITRKEIKLVPEDESEQTSKKTGIWSFLTKKPKKTTSENETNLSSEKHEDDSKVTRLFLQQEQNNYDDGLLHTKNESLENAPSILNKNLLQKKNSEKSGICESLLSKLKPSDSSLMDMEPSYVKFDEDDLAYNPVIVVPHENKKKVTFEEITHEEKLPTKELNDEQLPPAERLICRMKDMNSDAQISNTLVLSEEYNDERRFDEEVTVKGKEKHIIERKLEDDDLHDKSKKLSLFTPDIITTQTSDFLRTEITLYDGEKRTTGSTQNMQDEKCCVTKIPESGIINENLEPSDRTLGERETSRIKRLDSGDILESKTNVDINAKSDIVEIDGLSTNDTNASKFSDADLIIMSDTFLKHETTQYDDMKTIKPEADSIVTDNISKQQDDSKRKKFFNLFSKKKTVSDENVYSKETEHKREVKVEKVDPTSKQTELDIRGTTNVLNYSTKNRDEEVAMPLSEPNQHFMEIAKTTTNYEIPAIPTKTETANISNPISATCDFLITEKKFYDSMNSTKSLSHVDLQVESFGNKTTSKHISDQNEIFQEKKNLKYKKQSEKNNEAISPHDEFLLVSDLPCEVDNESKLQSYSSKISIPHLQNNIQSTDNFLHIEKNSYDSDINRNQGFFPGYSNDQKDETKTKQISKHLTISSNSFDHSDAELIDVPKENIEQQESVEISETDIKQTSESGKSNIVPEKSISKHEKLQYSSQELINSTFDFLRMEIMMYRDVKGPIVEEMSQETTVKENVENIEIDKQTYQSEKIPEKKSRRFLKIFGKKSKAKSEKNENKERAADIIATENFLKIEKTIYNNATSVSLEEKEPGIIENITDELNAITLENQASLTRDKNTKTKGIFKIFSRKSEEKDKVKVDCQTEIPKEIPVSENKSQMNKSSIISTENTNIYQTDILNTNSQDISKATDMFLNIEKKLYHDTECSVFNKSLMNEAGDDKCIPGASNSLVEEKQHPEKPAKRRKFLKIFQRKSEERDLLKDSKVREPHSEEKTAGDEVEEEKQVENRNRFNIFGKKSKPVEEKQAHHETRERTGDNIYNSRELIEMTNEFLQKEKTKYSDILPTTPINYISDNSSIDRSLTAIINCNKSGEKFNGYELHEHKPLDARVQLRNEKSCVAITLKGTETSKKCDPKFELREDSTNIPNVHIFSTDVNTREKDSNDIQSAGIKYSEIEKDAKIEKKFCSEDESMKQIAPKDLSSNIQTEIHDTYNIPITNKDEQIQSIKQNKSVENEIPIASDNRNTEQKKLKSKSLPTDILDKEGKAKSIFRIFSRRSRSRERKDQSTRIEQTKEENLSINNLKACKVFLEKEVELYPEPIPNMKSDYLKSTHSNISEAKGTDMSNILNTSEESSKQRHISSCSEEKKQSEYDQTKINEKDESSNDTFDSAATIQKELQSFQTSFQSGEKEHGQTIRNIQNIDVSSKENGNVKGDKEYTAFDFIEEEVKNFENSRLPFTDTIDSSFRVENEVVHIGGDEPKETITKKIIISEKLIEKPGPANSNSETMNAILEKLMNETFTHEVDHQPIDKQCSALTSEEISNENNIDENLISHVSQSSDKIPLQTKSKSKEKLECIEVEYVHKMKDLELAKGDVIEDVSPLEKKIEIISNDHSEEITDLDEGLQNELINTKNLTLVTETATELPILSTNVVEPMTISDAETYAEEGGCLVANSNNTVCEKKIAITKLTDKEIQQHDVPETVRVTENFIKEFEIQFHPDRSILSKDKDIATLSSNEMKDQVLDEITKWTSHNEFTNVHFSQDDNLFDDFVIDPSNQRTSNIVSSFELAEKIDPSSMFHSCTQQETGQEKNETARIDDAAQVKSSIHENIRENKSSDSSTRRPLFRLESDEDDFIIPFTPKELENQEHNISEVVMDHPPSLEQDEPKLELENIVAVGPKSDVQIIEDKLRDLGKALDALEKLSEIKSDNKNEQLNEKKLRRVERKFERMASETLESTKNNEQEVKTFNSAEIDPYQQLVSHLSTDEVISSQNDYNSLWDEYTFSKSDEWDSKTPESQADVLELPQGDGPTQSSGTTEISTIREQTHDSSRENQGCQVRPQTYDQQQLSEEMKELLEEMEKTNKK